MSQWEFRNLIVHIKNPVIIDEQFHKKIETFTDAEGLLGPKHVAYTIFPHGLYDSNGNVAKLFRAYNRAKGFYDRTKTGGWGNYFRRMANYKRLDSQGIDKPVNQLGNIIKSIRTRDRICKAAYSIVIQKPGGETIRPLGGPCLNYLAVQLEPGSGEQPLSLGLLAVYRNHDFLERAYGNYWGLCNLLRFLAKEVDGIAGPLTCISSHAYVPGKKTAFKKLVEEL